MQDSYQPIYDAVRSRISPFDGSQILDIITRQFEFSNYIPLIQESFCIAAEEMKSPSVLYRPELKIDGNMWCASYGEMPEGVQGFGESPAKAIEDFNTNWHMKLSEMKEKSDA